MEHLSYKCNTNQMLYIVDKHFILRTAKTAFQKWHSKQPLFDLLLESSVTIKTASRCSITRLISDNQNSLYVLYN